ncbi:hypothetical protein OH76DRAFT_1562400 [Lentinus brumalis]|uniref:Uncharacterized protein n=2 Tax=Lentinus brumalis TaxID=2498619 RepID=A0A371CGP4_9APHY|nr:hypothetical protein OH76DRAFT_1562400 [Polyporus brumalis]
MTASTPIIPGVPLATQLPKPDHSDPRGSVRRLLTELLTLATSDRCARMWWTLTAFQKHVVLRYGVLLLGWPPDIPFMSFSPGHGCPCMAEIRWLLTLLTAEPQPRMYFVRATPGQLDAARLDAAAAAPGPLFPAPTPLPYIGRSNIGRRRSVRHNEADGSVIPPRYIRDGPKSAKVIGEELDSEPSGWASGQICKTYGGQVDARQTSSASSTLYCKPQDSLVVSRAQLTCSSTPRLFLTGR